MRILIVGAGSCPLGFGKGSGAEAYTFTVARVLQRHGHKVSLMAHSDSAIPKDLPFIPVSGDFDVPQEELPVGSRAVEVSETSLTATMWREVVDLELLRCPTNICMMAQAQAESFSLSPSQYTVTGYGIDLDKYHYCPQPTLPLHLAWAGRIVPDKGLLDAVSAAGLAKMPLHVAGSVGNPSYWEKVKAAAEEYKTEIVYYGKLNLPELQAMVGSSYGFLMTPKWIEAFGIVVIESLACGTPVVSYRQGGPGNIVTPDIGFLVEPNDVQGLADAVGRVGEIPRELCRKVAESRWSEAAFGESMHRWLSQTLS